MSKKCVLKFVENQLSIDIEGEKIINIDCSNDIEINPLVMSLTEQIEKDEEIEFIEVSQELNDKQKIIVDLIKSIINSFNEVLKTSIDSEEIPF